MKEFFEAFFKPVYRFYYYTYDTDMISGHSDKSKCHIDMEIEKSKFTFEELQKGIEDGYSIVLNDKPYKCFKVEIYQPTFDITAEIREKLEEVIAQYFEEGGGAQYLGINSDGYSVYSWMRGKPATSDDFYGDTRSQALCKILIQYKDEIQEEVRSVFNEK